MIKIKMYLKNNKDKGIRDIILLMENICMMNMLKVIILMHMYLLDKMLLLDREDQICFSIVIIESQQLIIIEIICKFKYNI